MPETSLHPIGSTLVSLNRIIHQPARLAILTIVSVGNTADFTFLKTATGLSQGNLSVQLTRLEEAGLIAVTRTLEKKRTLTLVALTPVGRAELNRYWGEMERMRSHASPGEASRQHGMKYLVNS